MIRSQCDATHLFRQAWFSNEENQKYIYWAADEVGLQNADFKRFEKFVRPSINGDCTYVMAL